MTVNNNYLNVKQMLKSMEYKKSVVSNALNETKC